MPDELFRKPPKRNRPPVHPIVAVDLGFSQQSDTCGVATSERDLGVCSYAESIRKVSAYLEGIPEANLVLEAPLFGAFDGDGNPCGRLPFEKDGSRTRYWYTQPASSLTIAALYFLRRLGREIYGDTKIFLYEGFLAFRKHDEKVPLADARELIRLLEEGTSPVTADRLDGEVARCTSFLSFLPPYHQPVELFCPPVVVGA